MPSLPVYDGVNPANVFSAVSRLFTSHTPFGILYYLNGTTSVWPSFDIATAKSMTPYTLGIDVSAQGIGDLLDVENYDATPDQAPGWLLKRRADPQQIINPGIYCNKSTWPAVIRAINLAGINHPPYCIADPTGVMHLVPGSAMTQWSWMPGWDVSQTSEDWPWPTPPKPKILIPPILTTRRD